MDIEFETQQVVDSEEHRLLAALRDSALRDEEAVHAFYQKAVRSLDLEGNYLILLVHDVYDIPYRSRDGEHQEDVSSEVYSYILCSVCPIKMTKPALSYYMTDKEFRNCAIDWLVAAPELGFLFPAFDDRSTNIYNALYYSRDIAENHTGFVDEVFHCPLPMPAAEQKETFQAILEDTLAEDCSYDVVETVHEEFCNLIAEHKERKEPEPLAVSKRGWSREFWLPAEYQKTGWRHLQKNMMRHSARICSSARKISSMTKKSRCKPRTLLSRSAPSAGISSRPESSMEQNILLYGLTKAFRSTVSMSTSNKNHNH